MADYELYVQETMNKDRRFVAVERDTRWPYPIPNYTPPPIRVEALRIMKILKSQVRI